MEEFHGTGVCPHCGWDNSTEPENKQYLTPGTVLGNKYTIGTVIGAGGFGVTYVGWDDYLKRKVAIKEYFPSSLSTRVPGQTAISAFSGEKQQIFNHGKDRFVEEAGLLMRFTGEEGIVSVYDIFEANGTAYMVMEYVEGVTLKQSVERFGPVPEDQLLNFIIPMLLSLKFVHNAGYTHRDISPDNIMCQPDGSVKLLDFGAARYSVMEESQSLSVIVKQGFTPIEQYQSHGKQGPYTDIYAVGATMYKALTGITPDESLERMSSDTLKKPSQCGVSVSANTENAILAALNIRPEDRPQDIDEFLAILTGQKPGGLIGAKKKSKKGLIVGLAAGLAAIVGCTVIGAALIWPNIKGTVTVPDVIKKTEPVAREILVDKDLVLQIVGQEKYDENKIKQGYIEEGLVVSQAPASGEEVEKKTDVGVKLSIGKEKFEVLPPEDRPVDAVIAENDGIEFETEGVTSDEYAPGTVISSDVPEDGMIDFDGKIKLTVSLGRKTPITEEKSVTVGDYTGRDFNELKKELLGNDIYLVKAATVYSAEVPYGAVISQSPSPGSEIKSGGAVYVVTSLGIEKARVPDVRYLALDEAKDALMKAGLSWKISYVVDPTVAQGLVVGQGIKPYKKTPFGMEIELLVSAETAGSESRTILDISIEPERAEIAAGKTTALSCKGSGDGKVIWASSNPYIAEVDANGVVTGRNFGTVTVTAAVDGNIATAEITVSSEDIFSELTDYSLVVGDTVSFATSIPKSVLKDVVWRSTNPAAAAVDENGIVTAVKEGYATISGTYGNTTSSVGITVSKKIEYAKIARNTLLGSKYETAVQALKSNGIKYTVEDEYSDTISEGNVSRLNYVGYSDDNYYYIDKESTVTLKRSLGKNTVASLYIQTSPKKTTYYVGETPDYTGLVLTATYKDGTTKAVSSGYTGTKDALWDIGSRKLTVSYGGKSISYDITVKAVEAASVSVSPTSISLMPGNAATLSVTVTPSNTTNKNVTVTSSNTSVVRADGLTLMAVGSGTATITVKTANGKTATCTVTVALPNATSVTLSAKELNLGGGETKKLTATVSPSNAADKSVTWTSSDTNVATVDKSGNVTAVSNGTATVTAKTSNGYSASCTVRVSVAVSGVKVDSEISLKPGETKKLTATVSPSNAADKSVTWTSSDTNVATVDKSGNVTAVKSGTATITVKTANGKTAACAVTVQGETKLNMKTRPDKMIYYIGDNFTGTGMVLEYTDENGKTTNVTSGYEVSGVPMKKEGSHNLVISYKGLSVTLPVTVKTPSIKVGTFESLFGFFATADTEPADVTVTWTSSNPRIVRVENDSPAALYPVSPGTAYITGTMVYNGIEYSDSIPVTAAEMETEAPETDPPKISIKEYELTIRSDIGAGAAFWVECEYPGFDASKVKWSVVGDVPWEMYENDCFVHYLEYGKPRPFTVYASYTHNGETVTSSFTYTVTYEDYVETEADSGNWIYVDPVLSDLVVDWTK